MCMPTHTHGQAPRWQSKTPANRKTRDAARQPIHAKARTITSLSRFAEMICAFMASSSTVQRRETGESHILLPRGAMLWTAPGQQALQQLLLVQPVQLLTRPCLAMKSREKFLRPFFRRPRTKESTRAACGGRLAWVGSSGGLSIRTSTEH